MKTALLDVNVLMALAWPSHEAHGAAHEWWNEHPKRPWATCPVTELAFVRLSSNPVVVDPAPTPQRAAELLRAMLGAGKHVFWPNETCVSDEPAWPQPWVRGHRQVTDGRLLNIVVARRGLLITFDKGLHQAAPGEVELISLPGPKRT